MLLSPIRGGRSIFCIRKVEKPALQVERAIIRSVRPRVGVRNWSTCQGYAVDIAVPCYSTAKVIRLQTYHPYGVSESSIQNPMGRN